MSTSTNYSIPFKEYENEFQSLTRQVEQALEREANTGGGASGYSDDEGQSVESSFVLIQQCDELLQQMALEARSVNDNPSLKRELLSQVRNCKSTLQTLKEQSERQALLNSGRNNKNSNTHRERLLQQQDSILKQNLQLENAKRVMEETETVALEITTELGNNRETLESAHGRIHSVAGLTGRARRIVQSMNQRAIQQKMLLYGISGSIIIVFLILAGWLHR